MGRSPPASEAGASSLFRHARGGAATARGSGSSGRPCRLPLVSCGVEARLATDLEHHDLCRAQRPLRTRRDPDKVQMHLVSPLSVKGALRRPLSESAAGEVGDQLRRRRVEAGEVEHPLVVLVGHGHLLSYSGLSGHRPAGIRTQISGFGNRRAPVAPRSFDTPGPSCGRKKPPAGIEPAPRPYKGRVLAVDTTEARMRTDGVEPPQD
jgi:hypothetical protein